MGRFFNDKVVNKYRSNKLGLIAIVIIFIIVLFIIAFAYNNKSKNKNKNGVTYTLKDSISIYQYDEELPSIEDYFVEISDIDKVEVDTSNVDTSTPGKYNVTITIDGKETIFVLEVKELEIKEPNVSLNSVEIFEGEEYSIEDFVASCTDAYEEECSGITYYDEAFANITNINELSENQTKAIEEKISEYATYTTAGTYTINLTVIDSKGYVFNNHKTELIINKKQENNTTVNETKNETQNIVSTCEYGDLAYDTVKYPVVTYYVGDTTNNCAIDRNLWDNTTYTKKAFEIRDTDQKDIETKISDYYVKNNLNSDGSNIKYYANNKAIYNTSKTGLVGYSLEISIYIYDKNSELDYTNDLKLKYYINSDGSRSYTVNQFGLS